MTRRLSNTELVTLAVYLLGGEKRFVDTEDIAFKAHELSPGRFSWRKYPEQINLELIRVRLSEAKSADHGGFLRGTQRRGWTLTPAGLQWAIKVAEDLDSITAAPPETRDRGGSVDSQRLDRERARIRATVAWRKWHENAESISRNDADAVFRLDSYADAELRIAKIERLEKLFVDDEEYLGFIRFAKARLEK